MRWYNSAQVPCRFRDAKVTAMRQLRWLFLELPFGFQLSALLAAWIAWLAVLGWVSYRARLVVWRRVRPRVDREGPA